MLPALARVKTFRGEFGDAFIKHMTGGSASGGAGAKKPAMAGCEFWNTSMSNRAKFEEMVRNPDWGMVAEVLGEVPSALRGLYKTEAVLQSYWDVITGLPDDEGAYEIAEFEALRREWREEMWPELRDGCLTFADDGLGNHFFLRANTGPLWPVFFYDHEGGRITQIADSLETFLKMLRRAEEEE